MTWQEYQDAVGELYARMDGFGNVSKNITLPDKITGQPRQIDVWIELEAKTHKLGLLIDAKYHKTKIDVKDVEEVLSLGQAVGANKCVLVALNGWTDPAEVKARAVGLDLELITLEQALDIIVPDKWIVCPGCENDCIAIICQAGMVVENMWSLFTTGRCRECLLAAVHCWDCGDVILIDVKSEEECSCGHLWKNATDTLYVKACTSNTWSEISVDVPLLDPETANNYIQSGLEYKESGDFAKAIIEFSKSIEALPISAKSYYQRAITYDQTNMLDEAIADYTQAIENDPGFAMAFGSRGIALYTSGRFQEAINDLEHYLILEPTSSSRLIIERTIQHAKTLL